MAAHRQDKSGPVMTIDRDRLLKQTKRFDDPLLCYGKEGRKRTQVEIIGAEVGGRPCGRAADLGCLQCRLDYPRDAERDPVLQLEDLFQ